MINLTIAFEHPEASAHRVRYARVDNVLNPVWVTVSPDPITSPANIATDIPNGQYQIRSMPIYPDGRVCPEIIQQTPPCPGMLSINGYMSGNNLIVQYLAPSQVPKVRITVSYPNGGSHVANYVNNGANIPIALPNNLYGDFLVSGQSVCDEESGFYSSFSSTVTVSRSPVTVSAMLTFSFARGTTFNLFNAVLSAPIASSFTINQMYASGYTDAGCTIQGAAANKTTPVVINSGTIGVGFINPDSTTGDWTTVVKDSVFNVSINGSPVNDGDVVTIGSDNVIISIRTCE
jgi:hypothetical protein